MDDRKYLFRERLANEFKKFLNDDYSYKRLTQVMCRADKERLDDIISCAYVRGFDNGIAYKVITDKKS